MSLTILICSQPWSSVAQKMQVMILVLYLNINRETYKHTYSYIGKEKIHRKNITSGIIQEVKTSFFFYEFGKDLERLSVQETSILTHNLLKYTLFQLFFWGQLAICTSILKCSFIQIIWFLEMSLEDTCIHKYLLLNIIITVLCRIKTWKPVNI